MLPIVGIGAGLVAALLFSVVITGSPLAVVLWSVTPLPIFIAALGWNHRAGLVAVAVGSAAVAVSLSITAGIAFAIVIAAPAWWIAYLALLARDDGAGRVEWYPLGNLLVWIAGTAALATVGNALLFTSDYETYRAATQKVVEIFLNDAIRRRMIDLPSGFSLETLARAMGGWVPLGIGAWFVTLTVLNLWLAAKAVQLSGRLPRPWPFIPSTALPRQALVILALALVAASLGGFAGVAGAAMTGALFATFMFSGLAMLHDISRGKPWRTPMLVSVYVALVVMQAILTPLLALAGLLDSLIGLRKRVAPPPPPPPPNA